MTTLKPLHEIPDFPETFANALTRVESTPHVIADAYTHAPITPYAPIMGRMGIRADIERDMPGLTALPAEDVSPERRAHFAQTLEHIAAIELAAWERNVARHDEYALTGHSVGMQNTLARANRAAAESDYASDRAWAIRHSLGEV